MPGLAFWLVEQGRFARQDEGGEERQLDAAVDGQGGFGTVVRWFCPIWAARRMAESVALLVDEVLSPDPVRQWVLPVRFPPRYLFATDPAAMSAVLGIVC